MLGWHGVAQERTGWHGGGGACGAGVLAFRGIPWHNGARGGTALGALSSEPRVWEFRLHGWRVLRIRAHEVQRGVDLVIPRFP